MLKLGCRQNMMGMETKRARGKCILLTRWFVSFAELSCLVSCWYFHSRIFSAPTLTLMAYENPFFTI